MANASQAAPPRAAKEAVQPENPPVPDPHADYFSRTVPEPYRILGLTLRPLSIGRYRLMKRFQVAFVDDSEAKAGVADLLLGILICSLRCDDFLEFAQSPAFDREIRRWSKRVCPQPWLCALPFGIGKWWRAHRTFNVAQKIALFQRYIAEGSVAPRVWEESGGDSLSGAHWSQSIEVVLRSSVGWTIEEVNEAPLNKALWDFYKYLETQGAVRIMTADEIEAIDTPATPEHIAAMTEWARALQAAGIGTHFGPIPANPAP